VEPPARVVCVFGVMEATPSHPPVYATCTPAWPLEIVATTVAVLPTAENVFEAGATASVGAGVAGEPPETPGAKGENVPPPPPPHAASKRAARSAAVSRIVSGSRFTSSLRSETRSMPRSLR
jgi:hypothetical protein